MNYASNNTSSTDIIFFVQKYTTYFADNILIKRQNVT